MQLNPSASIRKEFARYSSLLVAAWQSCVLRLLHVILVACVTLVNQSHPTIWWITENPDYIACEQAPVGDSRVQSRANGMNREQSRFARGVTTL